MRVTKVALIVMAASLVVSAAAADEMGGFVIKGKTPTPVHFKADLASPFGANVKGWVVFDGLQSGGSYSFAARLVVSKVDFKAFGIDASNGFDDETVLLAISKKALALKLSYSHIEASGIVFTGAEMGASNETIVRGDLIQVFVNGNEAAGGKF